MFVFGHSGLTIAAARKADPEVDWRLAAVLALGPDLIDKPLRWLAPHFTHRNTRSLGHTLLFSAVLFLALLLWKRRPKTALLLWACYAGHFLLDAMWLGRNPAVLLWPLLGAFPPPVRGPFFDWPLLWNGLGELAGLAVVYPLLRQRLK